MSISAGVKLAPLVLDIETNTKAFIKDMAGVEKSGLNAAEKVSKSFKTAADATEKFSEKANSVSKTVAGVVAGLTGLGATVGGVVLGNFTDFTEATNVAKTSLSEFNEYSEQLGDIINNVYKDNFGESFEDVAASVTVAAQAFDGMGEDIQGITEKALLLRDTFGYEVNESVRAAKTLMENFNITSDEAFNLIAQGAQQGLDYSGELIDSINEYSVQFKKAGLSAEEMFTIYKNGMNEGAWNLDKIGDAVKEFNIRIIDGSNTTKEGLEALGLNMDEVAKKMTSGGETATETYNDIIDRLSKMDDKVAQNTAGVNLFGTMWEDLGSNATLALSGVNTSFDQTRDTMESMNDIRYDDLGSALEGLKRELTADVINPLGKELAPVANDLMDSVREHMPEIKEVLGDVGETVLNLVKSFVDMDDSTKKVIVTTTGLALALGPVTSGLSKTFNAASTIAGVFGKTGKFISGLKTAKTATDAVTTSTGLFTKGLTLINPITAGVAASLGVVAAGAAVVDAKTSLMNKTVTDSADDFTFLEGVMASLTGQTAYTTEELEELGIKYTEFSGDISKGFKKAVEDARDNIAQFNMELGKVSFDNVITPEEAEGLKTQISSAVNDALESINASRDKAQEVMVGLFNNDGIITAEEQAIIDSVNKQKETYMDETTKLKNELLDLIKRLNDTNNEEEINQLTGQIKDKYARLKQIELECQATTDDELMFAKQEFNEQVATMDADQAQKVLTQKAKERDDQIRIAKESYELQKKTLMEGYDSLNAEEKAQRDKGLQEAENNYNQQRQKQWDYWQSYLDTLEQNNYLVWENINKWNGKKTDAHDKQDEQTLNKFRETMKSLNSITESGYYTMWDTEKQTMRNMYVNVDEVTGQIVSVYDEYTKDAYGYNEELRQDVRNLASNMRDNYEAMKNKVGEYANSHVDAKNRIKNADGEIVGSLHDVTKAADGTREGIVNLNGHDITVKVNKKGTIDNLYEIDAYIDAIAAPRTVTFTAKAIQDSSMNVFQRYASSHYNGLDNVPYDGYIARLHRNERVLTAEENKVYNRVMSSGAVGDITVNVPVNLDGQVLTNVTDRISGEQIKMNRRLNGLL